MAPRRHQLGLTLIEILVAVVILSVGLLGLAGLQVLGLKNISISGTHAQAAILAHDLAERIHVNDSDVASYLPLDASSCPGTATIAQMDYCDVYATAVGDSNKDGGTTPDAGATRLFRSDGATELINVDACGGACGNPDMITITITWAERNLQGADVSRDYTFNFKP